MIKTKLIVGAAALAAVGLALAGCANTGSGTTATTAPKINLPVITTIQTPADAVLPKGDGTAKCASSTTIGYVGAETGANAALGINIYNGVQLAITQHNQANPGCQVKFLKFDTEGDPTKATGPVTQAVNTPGIIGVVGLPFSGESQATGNIFQQKGLVHITPSATNPGLTKNGWTTFFRALGNDNQQGPAAAQFVTKTLKLTKVFLVQDDSDYGIGLATAVGNALGKDEVGSDKVITGQKDFSSTVQKVLSSKATAVYYSGYYAEGAPFDQQLVNKGYKGVFIGPDGVKDPQFIKQAGSASSNAYFTCPCIPGELIPSFESAYKTAFGTDPGTYPNEGYDATTVLLAGIDKGNQTRAALLNWVTNYNADGLSKHYQWTSTGELTKATVYGYEVKDGNIVPIGVIGNK